MEQHDLRLPVGVLQDVLRRFCRGPDLNRRPAFHLLTQLDDHRERGANELARRTGDLLFSVDRLTGDVTARSSLAVVHMSILIHVAHTFMPQSRREVNNVSEQAQWTKNTKQLPTLCDTIPP